jgi:hypothetical protein
MRGEVKYLYPHAMPESYEDGTYCTKCGQSVVGSFCSHERPNYITICPDCDVVLTIPPCPKCGHGGRRIKR